MGDKQATVFGRSQGAKFGNEAADVMVALQRLTKYYGQVLAIRDVSLEIRRGEFFTLLGPSGSGKTTILLAVGGFVRPTYGEILIEGKSVLDIPPYRRDIGFVFQNYALFPHLNVFENVAFPLRVRRWSERDIRKAVRQTLELVQLEGLEMRRINQLSGGQQQRVALARTIVFKPKLLLMDEPLGALDRRLREQMLVELRKLQRDLKLTVLYVTHDQEEAMKLSDRIAVIAHGQVYQVGRPQDVYLSPGNIFVAEFFSIPNIFNGVVTRVESAHAVVRCEFGEAIAPLREGVTVGKRVAYVVRPGGVHFGTSDRDPAGRATGIVEDFTVVGDVCEVRVRLNTGGTLTVRRYGDVELSFTTGVEVPLWWPLEAAWLAWG